MAKIVILGLLLLGTFSCKKENGIVIQGTVKIKSGCYAGSWLVEIDHPDSALHPFICGQALAGTYYNCSNAVYIINLPDALAKEGTRIKFSKWKDEGILCLSYSFGAHHLQVSNAVAD